MLKASRFLIVFLVSVGCSELALSQSPDIEECRRLQKQIDYYTQLRKQGGSIMDMEQWKRARTEYESQFRGLGCHKVSKRQLRSN